VYVRNTSNIAKGGYSHNMTDSIHPSSILQAKKILEIFRGLPYIGIDFMCNDITVEQTERSYTIVEVNVNPGVAMHMLPGDNNPVNVANILVKLMFPEIFS
jgi:D-alanine-D-alanine ligase-like ATP-grasp enzyme